MGVIFITHDMGVVAEVADRVLVMYRGDKVEEGRFGRGLRPAAARLHARCCRRCRAWGHARHGRARAISAAARGRRGQGRAASVGSSPGPVAQPSTVRRENGPVLKVRDLTTTFDITGGILGRVQKRDAVEKVSFDLYPGETLSLVGESGCGKTTTGRSLLQLVKSRAGTIEFDGKNIGALRRACRRCASIQFIFQDPSPRWIRA